VRSGEPRRVRSALAAARDIAADADEREPSTAARALHLVGVASIRLGLLEDAEVAVGTLVRRALPSPFATWVADSFAQILVGQGAWTEGGRAMSLLLHRRRAANDWLGAAITAGGLARLYAELGEHNASRTFASEAFADLPDDASALTRLRLHTFVAMAALASHDASVEREVRELERLLSLSPAPHYLRGYAALTLSRAAAARSDDDAATRWLDAARSELNLPSQRTLVHYYETLQHPERVTDDGWRRDFQALCESVKMVTEGEMRTRLLAAERRAATDARIDELEGAYRRATESNNPMWIKWADDLARRVAPDYLAERLAQRFSGWARSELDRTRREDVTIVFADLAGFTARSVELDPDAVMSTVRGLFELAVPVMMKHRVSPITYMGDGLLAIARGDEHERRGVDFACSLLERAARVTALRRFLGDRWPLDLRAGVATGPVVLGTLGSALKLDFAAIGLTTNLAARLQSSASPQEVVCSEHAAQRAGRTLAIEELTLKGFEKIGPVRACRIAV